MTAMMTDSELEVEFILWEAEDPFDRPCEAQTVDCPNFALYRMLYVPARATYEGTPLPDCHHGTSVLCLKHKDWVLQQKPPGHPDLDHLFSCRRCNGFVRLKGIEPIRGR